MARLIEKVTRLEKALDLISSTVRLKVDEKEVGLVEACGMIASRDVRAPYDIPQFDRAAVDGYAVRAEDTYGASPVSPVELLLLGRIDASKSAEDIPYLKPGCAVEIATGAPLPRGANAVIMYEDVERRDDKVLVHRPIPRWSNVSRKGEDFQKGSPIVEKGSIVMPWHIAALASFGYSTIKVFRKVRVCVIATGSEIVEPKNPVPLSRGVYNSTAYIVLATLSRYRFLDVKYMGVVRDEVHTVQEVLSQAFSKECEVVITTGGTGVSPDDVVPQAVESMGKVLVRGIAIRPGRPTSVGYVDGRPIFMLSGFPVAAYIATEFLVIPAILRMVRAKSLKRHAIKAKLMRRVANVAGYRSFVRVKLYRCGDEMCAEPIRVTGSGVISSLIQGGGILVIPEDVEGYECGEIVDVFPLDFYP